MLWYIMCHEDMQWMRRIDSLWTSSHFCKSIVTPIPERNVEWHEGSIGKIQTQRHSVGLREPDRLPLSFDFSDE